jgi:hypothetical protein
MVRLPLVSARPSLWADVRAYIHAERRAYVVADAIAVVVHDEGVTAS